MWIALRKMQKADGSTVYRGDEIAEAETWRNRKSWESMGRICWTSEREASDLCAEAFESGLRPDRGFVAGPSSPADDANKHPEARVTTRGKKRGRPPKAKAKAKGTEATA